MYKIVPATKSHIYEMERLVKSCLDSNLVAYDREFYEWIFETEAVEAFVALSEDGESPPRMVGCVVGIAQQDAKAVRFGHVQLICVDSAHRRNGIATTLMHKIEQWFHVFGAQYAALHARKRDRAAMQFYCKLDYSNSKVVKRYYRNKQDAILFKKPLHQIEKKDK